MTDPARVTKVGFFARKGGGSTTHRVSWFDANPIKHGGGGVVNNAPAHRLCGTPGCVRPAGHEGDCVKADGA